MVGRRGARIPLLFVLSLAVSVLAQARHDLEPGEEVWVPVAGVASGEMIGLEEGRRVAYERALKRALEETLPVEVHGLIVREVVELDSDEWRQSFHQLVQLDFHGQIVDTEDPVYSTHLEGATPVYSCSLRVKVRRAYGEPDPTFNIDVRLDHENHIYSDGDAMRITVTPTQDCYFTVFCIWSNDTVSVLYPNARTPSRLHRGQEPVDFPSPEDKRKGIRYRVGLLDGRERDREVICIVATKREYPFVAGEAGATTDPYVIPGYHAAYVALGRWLVDIPVGDRAQEWVSYEIVPAE